MKIKVSVDREKVKSMLKLIENRETFLSSINMEKFSTIAAENYYEIIKELATALLLLDGFKTMGDGAHKELIDLLSDHKEISEDEIYTLQDLRIKRNQSSYEGKPINELYIQNKKKKLVSIIKKLKKIINDRI